MPIPAPIQSVPAGQVTCIGVEPGLAEALRLALQGEITVACLACAEELFAHMESGGAPVDSAVIGIAADDAVRLAQRIHIYDKLVPVMILSAPGGAETLRRTLMFSPFLGNEVAVWSTDELDVLPAALRQAVARRRQRLIHRNTLAKAQIRLEKLPLQQADATHYLDRLLDHAPVGVMTVNLGGTVITLNHRAQEMLGQDERGLLGQPLTKFFPRQDHVRLRRMLGMRAADGGQRSDVFTLPGGHGPDRHVEISAAALSYRTGQRGTMLILQDVTSRVEAEKRRRSAEEELRLHARVLRKFHEITSAENLSLFEKIDRVLRLGCTQFDLPAGLLTRREGGSLSIIRSVGDPQAYPAGARLDLDRTYCGMALDAEEPLTVGHASREAWANHPACRLSGVESYIGTAVRIDEDIKGTLCFLGRRPRSHPFSSADSELMKLMSRWVATELQRERAESRMRKLSGALERTADAIMITDHRRLIEYVNPSFERLTGYTKEEVMGKKSHFLRSGLHDDKFYHELWEVIGKGEVYRGRLVNRKKDGTFFHEQKTISPLKDENGRITHFISVGHDITDLVEAEEKYRAHQAELTHVARLSTLGEMTSGLAHELNQPLCAIKTYAQTCLHVIAKGDCKPEQVRYGLEQVVKQAELASGIFRRLRDFSRKGEFRQSEVSMDRILREVAEFVAAEAQQKRVRIERNLSPELQPAYVDAIQVEQVLLNLVRNAMDAVCPLEHARRRIALSAEPHERGWIVVEIRDHGKGCPGDMVNRMFEPFVTSKPKGLGIGLSISQGIIEAHGGTLWLAENSSRGAVFRFTLPTAEEAREDAT